MVLLVGAHIGEEGLVLPVVEQAEAGPDEAAHLHVENVHTVE